MSRAFENAARGLFSLIIDTNRVKPVLQKRITVTAPDREALLVNWLNELIYLSETERVLFREFNIEEMTDTKLVATAGGERIDRRRHNLKREVKAATYHRLSVEQKPEGWQIQVIFDI